MVVVVADLVNEISGIATVLSRRSSMPNASRTSDATTKMSTNMVAAFGNKLLSAHVDAMGAVRLYDAVATTGLDVDVANAIQTLIDDKISTDASSSTHIVGKATPTKPQVLLYPHTYLTGSQWAVIDDATISIKRKQMTLVACLRSVGMRSLHEQTKRPVVAILVWAHYKATNRWPTYHMIYEWVKEFTATFDRHSCNDIVEYLAVYPSSPYELPAAVYQAAYPDPSDPPVTADVPIDMISQHVPLRSSSKLLNIDMTNVLNGDDDDTHMKGFRFTPHGRAIMAGRMPQHTDRGYQSPSHMYRDPGGTHGTPALMYESMDMHNKPAGPFTPIPPIPPAHFMVQRTGSDVSLGDDSMDFTTSHSSTSARASAPVHPSHRENAYPQQPSDATGRLGARFELSDSPPTHGKPTSTQGALPPNGVGESTSTVEAVEEALFQKLKNNADSNKVAAAEKRKEKQAAARKATMDDHTATAKKPAASVITRKPAAADAPQPPTLKRPSAATASGTARTKHVVWDPTFSGRQQGWKSKFYKHGYKIARQDGCDDVGAKKIAADWYSVAKMVWDENN
jgi:hypothetical protein